MKNFEKQFSDLLAYEPIKDDRLRTLRTKAFESFIHTGLPTKKWEEWQFTDFTKLSNEEYRLARILIYHLYPIKFQEKYLIAIL